MRGVILPISKNHLLGWDEMLEEVIKEEEKSSQESSKVVIDRQ